MVPILPLNHYLAWMLIICRFLFSTHLVLRPLTRAFSVTRCAVPDPSFWNIFEFTSNRRWKNVDFVTSFSSRRASSTVTSIMFISRYTIWKFFSITDVLCRRQSAVSPTVACNIKVLCCTVSYSILNLKKTVAYNVPYLFIINCFMVLAFSM